MYLIYFQKYKEAKSLISWYIYRSIYESRPVELIGHVQSTVVRVKKDDILFSLSSFYPLLPLIIYYSIEKWIWKQKP